MQKTKIEWCDATWNPVTGCMHGCVYCYARRIAQRFGGASETHNNEICHECQWYTEGTGINHELEEPVFDYDRSRNAPFPFEFDPTFHIHRLVEPMHASKPRKIFVCSMGDLFGNWVPDEWIQAVFDACLTASQHTYLFLTKNPGRYVALAKAGMLPLESNLWYGSTVTGPEDPFFYHKDAKTFLSIEPMLEELNPADYSGSFDWQRWIILGAMTGPGSKDHQPKKEWIGTVVREARKIGLPVFMKDSLRAVWGKELIREYPTGMV